MLAVKFDVSLDEYLGKQEDILLQMREGGEVAASSYFVKNSQFSRCFVDLWLRMAPPASPEAAVKWVTTPNHDNGDLVVCFGQ